MHSRDLNCVDWFCVGCSLFDIDDLGQVVTKKFGMDNCWELVPPYFTACDTQLKKMNMKKLV